VKVQISIGGRKYTVRSDDTGEDLPEIARFVDSRMRALQEKAKNLDDYTVAMLTALNIASELDRFRREVDRSLEGVDRELAALGVVVDSSLEGAGEEGGEE
jgi:cell division protein ZapA (FtsZ GTPase activity inhibitor)